MVISFSGESEALELVEECVADIGGITPRKINT